MHRLSASISSFRNKDGSRDGRRNSTTSAGSGRSGGGGGLASPPIAPGKQEQLNQQYGEFGRVRSSNSAAGSLPPIPQEPSSTADRRRSQLPSLPYNSTTQPQRQQQQQQQAQPKQQARQTPPPQQAQQHQPAPSIRPQQPTQQQVRSATSALHHLPSKAELLNARKVYRAGYLWRLDGHPSSSPTGHLHPGSANATPTASSFGSSNASSNNGPVPKFVKYYMRLEDCILCLWPDEGLRRAQAQGTFIHPSSMNITDGFAVIAATKPEWAARGEQFDSPSPYLFVLNTAGNNSVTFATESEVDLRRWVNCIRLAIWERQRLENLYTATRIGIKEEQQLRPVRSAISFDNNGARLGRAEGLLDIRLPGDTEWKRVYAVLTEPGNYQASLARNGRAGSSASSETSGMPTSASTASFSSATTKKEKRRSILSSLLGGGNSSSRDGEGQGHHSRNGSSPSHDANASPVMQSSNLQLEAPQVGPTLALFGILSPSPSALASQNSRSGAEDSEPTSSGISATISSIPSSALKLTRRPLCVINAVWSAYAVWPESEALIPHSRTFKIHGRLTWLEHEVSPQGPRGKAGPRTPITPFEESMTRENRDLGRANGEAQLLCMLVGNDAEASVSGPGHAVRANFKGDISSELLSWILGFYDAFQLHGRPDKMIYDPRNPLSPYLAEPAGPRRAGLYFDPALMEDLPTFQDNHPRLINDTFVRLIVERMSRAGVPMPSSAYNSQNGSRSASPSVNAQQGHGSAGRGGLETPRDSRNASRASLADSTGPPVLPMIGLGGTEGSKPPTTASGRNTPSGGAEDSGGRAVQSVVQQGEARPSLDGASASQVQQHGPLPANSSRDYAQANVPSSAKGSQTQQSSPDLSGRHEGAEGRTPFMTPFQENVPVRAEDAASDTGSRTSGQHPGILRPGSAASSAHHGRRTSLEDVHGRNGSFFVEGQRAPERPLDQQAPEILQSTHNGSDTGNSDDQAVRDHYNPYRARSATPSNMDASSSRAPSALSSSLAPPLPGQYVPTPEPPASSGSPMSSNRALSPPSQAHARTTSGSSKDAASLHRDNSGQHNDRATAQHGSPAAGSSHIAAAGSPASQNRTFPPASLASSQASSQPPQANSKSTREESVLTDEPGALYALSLSDAEEQPQHAAAAAPSSSGRRAQPELSKLITQRAAAAGPAGVPVHSATQESDGSTLRNTPSAGPSRQATLGGYSGTPSAAPTSASDYSQTGTMPESIGVKSGAPSRSTSQHLPQHGRQTAEGMYSLNSAQATSSGPQLPQKAGVTTGDATSASGPLRQSKASAATVGSSIASEGQDDMLAGIHYLALTEANEPPPPASRSAQGDGKPSIRIRTDPSKPTNGHKDARTRGASVATDDSAAMTSPVYDEPLSPDPYGTYTEGAAAVAPKMHVINASPEKKPRQTSSSDKSRQASMSSHSSSRKPGRKGVPGGRQTGRKLGTWSSDEEDEEEEDKDSEDEEEEMERKKAEERQRKEAEDAAIAGAERTQAERKREAPPHHLRQSTASSGTGSLRRSLPGLPGPPTDPYLNENVSPGGSRLGSYEGRPYPHDMQSPHSGDPMRSSMYGWQGQMHMSGGGMMSPWMQQQQQHQQNRLSGGSPYGSNPHSPYGHSPSLSGNFNGPPGMNQNTMLSYMPDNPETAAADGRAMREAAVAQHGLLQSGLEQKHQKSAAQMEAQAKETGGPLLQLEHKAQAPQGGLIGAIASHERDRKRDGGLGATLTERDRDRRAAETRQREMDQMGMRQGLGGPGFGMPGFGGMMQGMQQPGGYQNMDPMQMQQQIAMLAAQNAYLQAMAGFNNQGMNPGMMGPQSFMSPPFSPQNQGYAGSYMGMGPPSHSPQPMHQQHSPYGGYGGPQQGHGHNDSRSQLDPYRR